MTLHLLLLHTEFSAQPAERQFLVVISNSALLPSIPSNIIEELSRAFTNIQNYRITHSPAYVLYHRLYIHVPTIVTFQRVKYNT